MYRQQISQKASASLRSTPTNKEIAPSPSYGSLSSVVQRVQHDPNSVSEDERQQLESAIGSRSTKEILAGKQTPWVPEFQGISAQLWGNVGQVGAPIQAKGKDDVGVAEVQPENTTGLPDELKAGVENLSGYSLDDVRVYYNSPKPDQLQALAYTQGTEIHVAPGQEKHLPHEAWHVVQQMQGRVKPTMQLKDEVLVNNDAGLEHEADVMGAKALQIKSQIKDDNYISAMSNSPKKDKELLQLSANLVYQLMWEVNSGVQGVVIRYVDRGGSNDRGVLNHLSKPELDADSDSLDDEIIRFWNKGDFHAGARTHISTARYHYIVILNNLLNNNFRFDVIHADRKDKYKQENQKITEKRFNQGGNGGKDPLKGKDISKLTADDYTKLFGL